MLKELFKESYEETEREKKEKWQAKGKIKLKLHHVDRIFQTFRRLLFLLVGFSGFG